MSCRTCSWVSVPINVFLHHPAVRYTRPDNRAGSNKSSVIVYFQLLHQASHGRTFNIETTNRISSAQQVFNLLVFLKSFNIIDVKVFCIGLIFLNDLYRVFDFTQAPLTQNIILVDSDIFRDVHIKMCGRKAFWRDDGSTKILNRFFGNDNSTGVYGEMAREPVNKSAVKHRETGYLIQLAWVVGALELLDFVGRQAQYFSNFANYRALLKRYEGTQQGSVRIGVKNELCYIIPIFP